MATWIMKSCLILSLSFLRKLINVNTCNDNENITVLKNYIENENSRKIQSKQGLKNFPNQLIAYGYTKP